jgi:hypothetical protein
MVADARCREARGASRGNTVRCKRSDTYSLTSRFGLPGNRARRSETAVAVRTRRSEDGARVRARWWENGARVRTRRWEDGAAACGDGRGRTALPTVADARCREARGASRGNTVRCKRSDTYSLTLRFGPPGSRARRSETAGAVRTRRSEDGARVRARWWETAGAAWGHGREGTAVPTVADARCREARGASRGNTVRCKRSDTYSLTSRFGLPGNRARRSETAGAACGHGRGRTAVPTVADARCREARGASRGNTVRCKRSDTYSLTSRFGPPGSRA